MRSGKFLKRSESKFVGRDPGFNHLRFPFLDGINESRLKWHWKSKSLWFFFSWNFEHRNFADFSTFIWFYSWNGMIKIESSRFRGFFQGKMIFLVKSKGRNWNHEISRIFLNKIQVTMLVPGRDSLGMQWKYRIKVEISYLRMKM